MFCLSNFVGTYIQRKDDQFVPGPQPREEFCAQKSLLDKRRNYKV